MINKLFALIALVSLPALVGDELVTKEAVFRLDSKTGGLLEVFDVSGGVSRVTALPNTYLIQRKSGDIELNEKNDTVKSTNHKANEFSYTCINDAFPQFEITKRYWIVDGVLRREFSFTNNSAEKVYVLPFTESVFTPVFKKKGYYFGAGYLGPFKPVAVVDRPYEVNDYVQTSKGMVLINADEGLGSYCHYRVKINDTVVYPWWQSAIGRYREKADRLYYMPNGWKMCLGALDVEPNGGSIRLTDAFAFFHGGLHDFFNNVYGRDTEIMNLLKVIEPVPEVLGDIVAYAGGVSNDTMHYLGEMLDEGSFLYVTSYLGTWFDYGVKPTYAGWQGGEISFYDLKRFFDSIRNEVPGRVLATNYSIGISATKNAPVFMQHQDWFRMLDRAGKLDSLFPAWSDNYQAMYNRPAVREFFVDSVISHAKAMNHQMVYVDEAQQYNVINWQSGETMRDDHCIELWRRLRTEAVKNNLIVTMNGSGQPYGDFNFMENAPLLSPAKWREYAGVALGLELFGQFVPGSRIGPLYWNLLKDNDYTNRVLALGWIMCLAYYAEKQPLAPVRAAFEVGNAEPVKVNFTPDWKRDPDSDVEAYAIRRSHSQDCMVSFINRGDKKDLPVTIELDSLGYRKNTRLNIWRMPVWRFGYDIPKNECKTGDFFYLANKEYRELYRNYGWTGGFVGVPTLVFSGKASGFFNDTAPAIERDHMVQYVISPSPLSIYSINDLASNYYFTKARKVVIEGNRIINQNNKVEVLFADADSEFTDISIDGKKVAVKLVDVGGKRMQLVEVPSGQHTIDYVKIERMALSAASPKAFCDAEKKAIVVENAGEKLYALSIRGHVIYSGPAPITVPPQHEGGVYELRELGCAAACSVILPEGAGTSVPRVTGFTVVHPAEKELREVNRKLGEVTLRKSATYISDWKDAYDLQREMKPSEVEANPEELLLRTTTTSRERGCYVSHYTRNFAGFELDGAKSMKLKLRSNFGQAQGLVPGHITYNFKRPREDFAGFVIDFSVNGNYAKRVALSVSIYNKQLEATLPPWGCARKLDVHYDLGPMADNAPEQTFSIGLAEIAPPNWDGKVFFTLGSSNLSANRKLEIEILGFNDDNAKDFLTLSTAKFGTPAPLSLPRLTHAPTIGTHFIGDSFKNWAKIEHLQALKITKRELTQQTHGYLAYDDDNLYIAVFAEETVRKLIAYDQPLWKNDCIELYFINPAEQILQMVIDARGKMSFSIFKEGGLSTEGIKVGGQIVDGKGFWSVVSIPWKTICVNAASMGTSIKFNLCRSRSGEESEYGTWGACEQRYAEPDGFGTLQLGRFSMGQGRWEEIVIDK